MRKPLMFAILMGLFASGCGGDDADSGPSVAPECAWTGDCPSDWKKSGNTCKYTAGPTVTLEGTVSVYQFNTPVNAAVVKILNFDSLIPPCGVSDPNGAVKIEGIPVGTDVTTSAFASDSYQGNPTYSFHFTVDPIQADTTAKTIYLINNLIGATFVGLLQSKGFGGLGADRGVIAGTVYQSDRTTGMARTAVTASSALADTKIYYIDGLTVSETPAKTGTFVAANLPAGRSKLTAQTDGKEVGSSEAVVYPQTISLASIYAK